MREERAGEKRCTRCGDWKSLASFSPHKLGRGGVRSICKPCSVLAVTEYRKTDAGRAADRMATRTYRDTVRGASNRADAQRRAVATNPAKYLLIRAKCRAKRLGLPFDLSLSDIVIPERCPVLGTKLVVAKSVFRGNGFSGTEDSMSLDRIRPELGYVRGNVAIISWRANRMKGAATLVDLERLVAWLRTRV